MDEGRYLDYAAHSASGALAAAAAAQPGEQCAASVPFHSIDSLHCRHLKVLEEKEIFAVILAELRNVLEKKLFDPWPEENLYETSSKEGGSWNVFGLYSFGEK